MTLLLFFPTYRFQGFFIRVFIFVESYIDLFCFRCAYGFGGFIKELLIILRLFLGTNVPSCLVLISWTDM